MRSRNILIGRWCVLGLVLAAPACGDNEGHNGNPDAHVTPDTPTTPDAFVECNYTEAHDTTNDYLAVSGAVEQTGITFNTSGRTVCGTINNGHFDLNQYSVDIDNYGLTLAHDADVLVTLTAPGAGSIAAFNLGVYAVDSGSRGVGGGLFVGDHAVFSAHLLAGTYEFSVEAYANADITASIPYKMHITSDSPLTRCPKATAAANYTEANDGAQNNGNDVIDIDYSAPFASRRTLTPSTTDAPETTNLTLASGTSYRISGTAAAVAQTGSYFDRDSYTIRTGPTTNQLAIRLNWPSTTADFDWYLFDNLTPLGTGAKMMLGEDEFATFAVAPSTSYNLWVGAYQSSTGLPATYDATICAEAFTP